MRTDAFIDLLAQDARGPRGLRTAVAWAAAGGAVVAMIVFLATIGVRPDVGPALHTLRFPFKFVVTFALAATGLRAALRLARPEARAGWSLAPLLVAPALIACAVAAELGGLPESRWLPSLIGHNAVFCTTLIPMLAVAPLAGLLLALRGGAPASPTLSGAVAGLAAGGIAATLYAAHCNDDSPLFVAFWYTLAVLGVSLVGTLVGRRVLAW